MKKFLRTMILAVFFSIVFSTNIQYALADNEQILSAGSYDELVSAIGEINENGIIEITADIPVPETINIYNKDILIRSSSGSTYKIVKDMKAEYRLFSMFDIGWDPVQGVDTPASLEFENIIIDGDKDSYDGSQDQDGVTALRVMGGSTLIIGEGAVLQNHRWGVAECWDGDIRITGGEIRNNENKNGGDILDLYGNFYMSGGIISDNFSDSNIIKSSIYFEMTGGSITNNETSERSCIHIEYSPALIDGGTISGNNRNSRYGAIYTFFCDLTMNNGTITNNGGPDCEGGGIYLERSNATITDSTVSGNSACYGGGIVVFSSSLIMNGGDISNNKAKYDGGGILFNRDPDVTLNGVTISGNSAGDNGGGIGGATSGYVSFANVSLNDCKIINNHADESGGGVAVLSGFPEDIDDMESGIWMMDNCTVSDNEAGYWGGGISIGFDFDLLYDNEGNDYSNNTGIFNISNSTIHDNYAGAGGSGIYIFEGSSFSIGEKVKIDTNNEVLIGRDCIITVTENFSPDAPVISVLPQFPPENDKPIKIAMTGEGVDINALLDKFSSAFKWYKPVIEDSCIYLARVNDSAESLEALNYPAIFKYINTIDSISEIINSRPFTRIMNKYDILSALYNDSDLLSVTPDYWMDLARLSYIDDKDIGGKLSKAVNSFPGLSPICYIKAELFSDSNSVAIDTIPMVHKFTVPEPQQDSRNFYIVYMGEDGMVHCLYDLDDNPATITYMIDVGVTDGTGISKSTIYALAYGNIGAPTPPPVYALATPAPEPSPTPMPTASDAPAIGTVIKPYIWWLSGGIGVVIIALIVIFTTKHNKLKKGK